MTDDNFSEPNRVEKRLRDSEARLEAELAATQRLQEASIQLIGDDTPEELYETILDATVAVMRADYASMQVLYPERGSGGELRLLAFRGFNPQAAKFWEWVRADSESTCGAALRTGRRVIATDVETCDFMAGSEDLATYLQTGIRAVQTTPLVSRGGRVIGMISTHWSKPHEPSERDLRLLDVLARQAADLIERTQAEQALRASERRSRDLLDALPAALYTTDAQGRITYYNHAAVELAGREPVLGSDEWCVSWKLYRADGTPLSHDECPMAIALKENRAVRDVEAIAERPDGTRVSFIPYPTPLRDEAGALAGAVNMLVDITERQRAEDALRESEGRLRAIFESAAVGAAILTTTARFVEVNAVFCSITGHSAEELKSLDFAALTHPDDFPRTREAIAELLNGKAPSVVLEKRYVRKDGSLAWVQNSFSLARDAKGQPAHVVVLCQDIQDRKRAELEAAQLSAIVISSNDAIVTKSLDGRVTSWNAAATRIFGYDASEMIGQHITRIIPPDLHDEESRIIAKLTRGERIEHFDTVRVAKDGRRVDVSLTVSPLREKSGRIVGASKIARDITDRKRAEETQQLLIGELNHRVKNMLATIQAIAQQTLRRTKNPEEFVPSFTGRIEALSRIHTLLTRATWKGADLRELVHDQVLLGSIHESRLTAWGPSLTFEPQVALHMAMVLHELGTNSRKYGALSVREGRVAVNWTIQSGELRLRWVERGGPLVKAPVSRGFGTSLIEQSMKAHQGSFDSVWEADGVTWTIALPMAAATAAAIEQSSSASDGAMGTGGANQSDRFSEGAPAAGLQGKLVLVVEDEPLVALDIVAGLQTAGIDVAGPASTAEEAMKLVESASLDAALVDANLRGAPVGELASALTRHDVPFAFVTGYTRESLPEAFRGAAMVPKPFSHEALIDAVEKLLAERQNRSRAAVLRGRPA